MRKGLKWWNFRERPSTATLQGAVVLWWFWRKRSWRFQVRVHKLPLRCMAVFPHTAPPVNCLSLVIGSLLLSCSWLLFFIPSSSKDHIPEQPDRLRVWGTSHPDLWGHRWPHTDHLLEFWKQGVHWRTAGQDIFLLVLFRNENYKMILKLVFFKPDTF